MSRHVYITMKYVKSDDYWGLTIIDDYNTKNKPRHFIIEVNRNINESEKLLTIAHEMVHIKQYVKGELNEHMSYWRGREIKKELPYMEQPWEKEAFRLGDKLYGEYHGYV